jgi:hypothetical protein
MSGEAKTLKQVEAAQSVIRDALSLLETFSPRQNRETEARFVYAAMTLTRMRLEDVQAELSKARFRATVSPVSAAIVSKEVLEDVRMFRALGPPRLSSLLKSRLLDRARQRHEGLGEDDDGAMSEVAISANEAALP